MKRPAYIAMLAMVLFLGACSAKPQESKPSAPSQSESQPQQESPTMNIEEIVAGNYSSIAGIWVSSSGEKLVFNKDGLVISDFHPEAPTLTYFGTADMVVTGGLRGGFLLEMIPAGVTIEDQQDDEGNVVFHDSSDSSKDRLWVGNSEQPYQEAGNFFYRMQ